MSKRTHFHLVGAALAPATVLALGNAPALADRNHGAVKCGDTVTADTELAGDLIDCSGDGIVIGADDIELDLNSHTIDGDDVPAPCDPAACDTDL